MIRRPFFALLGLGVGVTLGLWTARRIDQARQAMAPSNVAARAGEQAGALGGRLSAAIAAGRQAAQQHEAELRAAFGVSAGTPGSREGGSALPAPGSPAPVDRASGQADAGGAGLP